MVAPIKENMKQTLKYAAETERGALTSKYEKQMDDAQARIDHEQHSMHMTLQCAYNFLGGCEES